MGAPIPRVLNKHRDEIPAEAINCMRPSKWGNPFRIGVDGTRGDVIEKHRRWLLHNVALLAQIGELAGRDLVCCCAPESCHCDTLLEFANPPKKRGRRGRGLD